MQCIGKTGNPRQPAKMFRQSSAVAAAHSERHERTELGRVSPTLDLYRSQTHSGVSNERSLDLSTSWSGMLPKTDKSLFVSTCQECEVKFTVQVNLPGPKSAKLERSPCLKFIGLSRRSGSYAEGPN